MPTMLTLQMGLPTTSRAQLGHNLFTRSSSSVRAGRVIHCEAEVGLPILADVLDDGVHFDVGVGHSTQDLVCNARTVGHAKQWKSWLRRG